jgi:tyrosyl-tRNA synthetase
MKMSKSLNNYIGVAESPSDIYGKTMSLPDKLIGMYFELLTDIPDKELSEIQTAVEDETTNPMGYKKQLARNLVTQFYNEQLATEAARGFERIVQRGELPQDIRTFLLPSETKIATMKVSHIIVAADLAPSVGQARRLIQQGAVEVEGQRLQSDQPAQSLPIGGVLKVGKRNFVRLTVKGQANL